jgi:hypothetical protein
MTHWTAITDEQSIPPGMVKRIRERGPIFIIHAAGEFATMNGAKFMTALVALPGESWEDCLKRHQIEVDDDSYIFNFAFDPRLGSAD